jgi:hypothetical protein
MSLGGLWCASETLSFFHLLFLFVPCVRLLACVEGTCGLGERFANALPRHMRWQVLSSTRLVILVSCRLFSERGS